MANPATFVLAIGALAASSALLATDGVAPSAGAIPFFSTRAPGSALGDWALQPVRGVKHATQFTLIRDEDIGKTVLEGVADGAAGAVIYRFDASARTTPILKFGWKVGNLIMSSDPKTKAGDDYSARIYITFAYDPERATVREKAENTVAHMLYGETPPHAALAYVFTHKLATGTIVTSPYTHRVKKLVVDADPASVGKWKQFERDIYDDYRKAFNEEPTRISGIAIMVDTDNTGERARSRFSDVTLSPR